MLKMLLRTLLQALFRVEVEGDQGTFHNQRTLIVANHESYIDGLLLHLSEKTRARAKRSCCSPRRPS